MNYEKDSLIEEIYALFKDKDEPQNIKEVIKEVLDKCNIVDETGDLTIQLYVDMIASSKFVFVGEEKWDLKSRQSLEMFDRDGSSFNSKDDYFEEPDEDEEDETGASDISDYDLEDTSVASMQDADEDEDNLNDNLDEEDEENFDEDEDNLDEDDFDDDDEDDFDDDDESLSDYNKYMDDYEDMYDE